MEHFIFATVIMVMVTLAVIEGKRHKKWMKNLDAQEKEIDSFIERNGLKVTEESKHHGR